MTERNRAWAAAGMVLAGALLGIIAIGAARFVALTDEHTVHYHANWAIYVDGDRLDLSAGRYMEDVFQCLADPAHQRPEDRVHMHENDHDVVHVHAPGVTWGHLLANIGFGVGDDYLVTDEARYENEEGRSLRFVLNGEEVRSIRNLRIEDEDRLLISYGPASADELIRTVFPKVASSAGEFNLVPDPASCSGHQEASLGERIRRALLY